MKKNIEALCKASELSFGLVAAPGSSMAFKTGDWRSLRPVLDRENCVYCGFCYNYCPEGIYKDMGPDEKYYEVDLDYCKGCGICAYECPKKCIQMVHEEG